MAKSILEIGPAGHDKAARLLYLRTKNGSDTILIVHEPIHLNVFAAFKAHITNPTQQSRALEFMSHSKNADNSLRYLTHIIDLDSIYEMRYE